MKTNDIPDRRKFKTVDDFLRWLDNRKAGLKQAAEEEAARHSAMVWADDGGRPVEPPAEGAAQPGD